MNRSETFEALLDIATMYIDHIIAIAPCPPEGMDAGEGDRLWRVTIAKVCYGMVADEMRSGDLDRDRLDKRLHEYKLHVVAVSAGDLASQPGWDPETGAVWA